MSRVTRRVRRSIDSHNVRFLKLCGFRYSTSRDAYVLRFVGRHFGPVYEVRPYSSSSHDLPTH